MSKKTCSFEEPDVLAACAGDNALECMRAWQQRGNASTCVRCQDCTTGDCAMRCSTDDHADAPLKRMDCAEGCGAGTCKDTLECGDHDDIFVDTYNAEKVSGTAEKRVEEAKVSLCRSKDTQETCLFKDSPCSWDEVAEKCSYNVPESLAREALNACTGDPTQDAFIPGCQ